MFQANNQFPNGLFQKTSTPPYPQWRKLTIPSPSPDILHKFKMVEISSVGGLWIFFGTTQYITMKMGTVFCVNWLTELFQYMNIDGLFS